MQDLMTFQATRSQRQCDLCSMNPAVLEFSILSDQGNSRQQGSCCNLCARNLLDALSKIKPQSP